MAEEQDDWTINTIPPNNLDDLIPWMRIFAESLDRKIHELEIAIANKQDKTKPK